MGREGRGKGKSLAPNLRRLATPLHACVITLHVAAKNYYYCPSVVQVIVDNAVTCFLRHSVESVNVQCKSLTSFTSKMSKEIE